MPVKLAMKILKLSDQPQAIPQLAEWHHQQWAALNPGQTLQQRIDNMQAYLSDELVPSTYLAQGAVLMGSAAMIAHDMDTHPELTPWLASVFVAPPFRRQGIGSQLVRHVMQTARQAGVKTLYLFTPDQENFYQRLGWRVLNRESYRGHQVTLMTVELPDWHG